jgi:hypothetical protein
VKIDRAKEPFTLPARVVDEIAPAPGGVRGAGTAAYSLAPNQTMGVKALNRLLKAGASASWASDNTIVVQGVSRDVVDQQGKALGVVFTALDAAPSGGRAIRAPRIGLYRSHRANMDEGWTRWVLEQYEFAYTTLKNEDVRTGDLTKFDVVLFADEAEDTILNGHLPGTMPAEFVGGIGPDGTANVRRFVENGGWLVAWDTAVNFAIHALGLPLRNTVADTRPSEFFIPGSLLRLTTKPENPLAAGMEASAVAMFADSQALQVVPPAAEGTKRAERTVDVYAEFPRQDLLVSGWELGASRYVAGRAAAVRVPVGNGQAVVMAIRPHWRGQPHNTFKLLFNPLYLSTAK